MKKIKIKASGTIANLVCGFDILGLALEEPFDTITLQLLDKPEVHITNEDDFGLPEEPDKNVVGVVLQEIVKACDAPIGFNAIVHKNIKPGSGLGSSAASAAGAAVAANLLLDNKFTDDDIIRFAMQGEKLACGVKHADNITPCILGGVTLIRSIHPLDIITLPYPDLHVVVVHPQIEVKTSDARQILRQQVPLKNAIRQWGNIAGLVAGFMNKDTALIARSLEDVIIEPVRSILIPGFDAVKSQSIDCGALGGGISGSGPSIFMLCETRSSAEQTGVAMKSIYDIMGVDYHIYITKINKNGVEVITE